MSTYESITLTQAVDDLIIFVGAMNLPGSTLGLAGPTGYSAEGDLFRSRITDDFRGLGPVTDFEPWAGSVTFDTGANWSFDLAGPVSGKNDFISVAIHEIGHILGIGTSGAFDALVWGNSFHGVNATALNGGTPVPLHSDDSHVEEGFADNSVSLDPTLTVGTRTLPSDFDKAILADIGYEVAGFSKQGTQPAIATNSGETIFGTIIGDTIDGKGGADQIQGNAGNDVISGGGGADTIFGEAGDDTLYGDAGDDRIQGGTGADVIRGGAGDDDIWGQSGNDIFVIGLGDGQNTVYDFSPSTEIIRLIDSGFSNVAQALAAISKPYSNVSRLTLSDGTYIDLFHSSQSGTPITASNIELVSSGGNSAPGGALVISGSAVQGQTLTANTSSITDANGLGAFSYTWLRDGAVVSGASAAQYALTQADVGANIAVRVTYTDGGGTVETVTSAATVDVQNVNDAPTGAVTLSGTARQGVTLTAQTGSLQDADGLGSFSYLWLRNGNAISGATGTQYTLGQADVGKAVSVRVSYTDGQGTSETVTSAATASVQNVNDLPTGSVTISGTARQGSSLTAQTAGLSDADGLGAFSYTWLRDGAAISGATGSQYILTQADVGRAISVRVSYTDGQGTSESVTSAATGAVQNVNDAPVGSVLLSGSAVEGATLSANAAGVSDADGLGSFSYVWLRDGTVIQGASGSTYQLTQADVGKAISVRVAYTDGGGTAETVTSAATSPVQNVNAAPSGTISLTGIARQGETLTANTGSLADADGLGPLSYLWLRDGEAIPGATGASLTLTQADVGAAISLRVSYIDGGGTAEAVTSAATSAVLNVNDAPTGSVTLGGQALQGATLTAETASLQDADGLGPFGYTWLRDDAPIAGANGASYVLTQADVGAQIAVRVSYTDGQGTSEAQVSAKTGPVANANDAPTGLPVISGSAVEGATLTVNTLAIADEDGLGPFTYTWLRDGQTFGATGANFVLTEAEVGTAISVRVSYTDGFGRSEQVTSDATSAIQNVNDAPSGAVTLSGTAVQGAVLSAQTGGLSDEDGLGAFSYAWLRDGSPIAGAVSQTYGLTQADVGRAISVRVSYTDGHGAAESVTSAATSAVQNVNDAPEGGVSILGTALEGQTLTAQTASLSDADGLGALSYTWLRDGVAIGTTGSSHVLQAADIGARISVRVSYVDGGGTTESVTSAATPVVENLNAPPTGAVQITGTAREYETLTASAASLADADGLGAVTLTWLRDGVSTGVTGPTYTLEQADVGARMSVRATYVDGEGTAEAVTSAATAQVQNVNDPLTGTVTLAGAPIEGSVLTAQTATLADDDGLGPLSYVWLRDGTAVPGASGAQYLLTQSDVNTEIAVRVSYVDGQGTSESTTSATVGFVENVNNAPTGNVSVVGSPVKGSVLSASATLADADGMGALTFTWLRDGVAIGATGPTYVLQQDDIGARMSVRASYTDGWGTPESVTSLRTTAVQNLNTSPTGSVTISGLAREGETLSASAASVQDADGMGPLTLTWLRDGQSTGVTGASYVLGDDDVGARMSVTARYRDGFGTVETVQSALTGVVGNVNDLPAGAVILVGEMRQNALIEAVTTTLTDADGLGAFSYQWLRDGTPISGASQAGYVLTQADVGGDIGVTVSYVDDHGTAETVTAAPRGPVLDANDDPTGTVNIAGSLVEGAVLTAVTAGLADADGLGPFSHQWLRDGVPVAGATGVTYALTQADVGTKIGVQVSYVDGGGFAETVSSAPTGNIGNVNNAPTGQVTVSGTARQGSTLTVDATTVRDDDGLGDFAFVWLRDGTAFGATGQSYTLGQEDVGSRLSVRLSYTDDGDTTEQLTSDLTAPIENTNDAPVGAVAITGTAAEGQTLTVDTSTLADPDGLGALSFTWLRDGEPTGVTGTSYLLGPEDVDASLAVRVRYIDGGGAEEVLTSAPTAAIANRNDPPVGMVTITGTASQGRELRAETGGVSDADGLGSFNYTWLRDGVAIPGAREAGYVLTQADVDARISVEVRYTDGQGTLERLTSAATGLVTNANDAVSGSVLVFGTLRQGSILTASTGGLSDPDGIGPFAFTWLRDGTPIDGATAGTYRLTQADVGADMQVQVRFVDGRGTEEFAASVPRGPVGNLNDNPTGTVAITGDTREGETLTVDVSSIADEDGLGTFSYFWLRNGADTGATGARYVLTDADIGTKLSVRASYTDGHGTTETLVSAATSTVLNVNDAPTGAPVITGRAQEGQRLQADTASIGDHDGLGTFAFQWLRDGTPITGATGAAYDLTVDDVDAQITLVVRYTDARGTDERLESAATGPVASVDEVLTGDAGDNVLFGDVGDDTLSGGPGNDTLEGGTGADLFVVNPGDERITISDFETGVDRIDLSGFDRAEALSAYFGATPGSAILQFADGTILTVQGDGVTPATLTQDNLIFAPGNLAPTGVPVLKGGLVEGSVVTVDVSGVKDGDGIDPSTTRLQWLRDGVPIVGAKSVGMVLGAQDVGAQISVRFSFDDLFGTSESVVSLASAPVAAKPMALTGNRTSEALVGGRGNDRIDGADGDDTLTGAEGDDLIDGGEGIDTVRLSGNQSSYTLVLGPDGTTITDRRDGGDGTDTLRDVEFLDFATELAAFGEGPMDLRVFGGPVGLTEEAFESLIEMYIAYFDRAPDAIGLYFWATAFANGTSLDEMARLFLDQDETRAAYPEGSTATKFAMSVYSNVLGRLPDQEGFSFWVNLLDSGKVARDGFILEVLRGAKADPAEGASAAFVVQQQADRDYLAGKTDIGAYYAVHKGMSDVADAAAVMAAFDGTPEGMAAALAAIRAYHEAAMDPDDGAFLMPLVGVLDDPFGV